MSRRVLMVLKDDIDGGDANQSVRFSLDGVGYEIDLSDANAARLRQQLEPWVDSARRTRGRRGANRQSAHRPTASGLTAEDLRAVRAWAPTAGFDLAARGRVPGHVLDAYAQAHS